MPAPSKAPRRVAVALAALVLFVLALAAMTGPVDASGHSVSVAGPLTVYDVPNNALAAVTASVHQVVTGSGATIVTLHLAGFGPDVAGRTFGAHAHVYGCGTTGTNPGPHYTHPGPSADLEHQEIWLDFTVDPGGTAQAKAVRNWTIVPTATAPQGARSVVVHAAPTTPAGVAAGRLACIDVPFVG